MQRYFFHLRRGETLIEDSEGSEFRSTGEARVDAILEAKELVVNSVWSGQPINGDCIEIWIEGGGCVGEVRLRDVIPLKPNSSL